MSNPNQTPDSAPTLESISAQVIQVGKELSPLKETISDLGGEIAKLRSTLKVNTWLPVVCAIIAAVATIIAAVSTFFAGSMTANTSTALTRITTIYSEVAKKDSDIYDVARDQVAALEQAFETFLFEKKLTKENDPYRVAANLDKMCMANRFGSRTSDIRNFNDFIGKAIFTLQQNQDRWKDVDALRKEAQDKFRQALEALDALEQKK